MKSDNKSYFLSLILDSIANLKFNYKNKEINCKQKTKQNYNNLSTDKVSIDDDSIGVEINLNHNEITSKYSYISKDQRFVFMSIILKDPLVLKIYKSKKLIN